MRTTWACLPIFTTAVLLAGCGGGAAAFVGTWVVASGTQGLACGGQITSSPVTGTITISYGSNSNIITSSVLMPSTIMGTGNCRLDWTPSGTDATLDSNQACNTTSTQAVSYSAGSIALGSNNLILSLTATETTMGNNGPTTCSLNLMVNANKT